MCVCVYTGNHVESVSLLISRGAKVTKALVAEHESVVGRALQSFVKVQVTGEFGDVMPPAFNTSPVRTTDNIYCYIISRLIVATKSVRKLTYVYIY
jgi:hypothetical protein